MSVHRLALSLALLLSLSGCKGPYLASFVVRHAEKVTAAMDPNVDPNDPPLTAAGVARAKVLAGQLKGSNVIAVYATDYKRTRGTAQPLADAVGVPVTIYTTPADVVARVRPLPRGKAVLIVGHTTTVPQIITGLGADLPASLPNPIHEDDFDNLVLVLDNGKDKPAAVHTTYGAKSP